MAKNTSITDVLARLKRHTAAITHKGATDAQVRSIESTLGVSLPQSYVAFLKTCGWADLNGETLLGAAPATKIESVVKMASVEHAEQDPDGVAMMASHLIPIMTDGAGNYDCLDTSKLKDGECPVVFWDHEFYDSRPERVAGSFTQWLSKKIDRLPAPLPVGGKVSEEVQQVLARLMAHPRVKVHKPPTDEEQRDFARMMQMRIPKSYLAFGQTCGWALLNGKTTVFGITKYDAPGCAISATDDAISDFELRSKHLVIRKVARGNVECLATKQMKNGECPVVLWNRQDPKGIMQKPKQVAKNFADWLNKRLDELPGSAPRGTK